MLPHVGESNDQITGARPVFDTLQRQEIFSSTKVEPALKSSETAIHVVSELRMDGTHLHSHTNVHSV
jgi:hypothetical protein